MQLGANNFGGKYKYFRSLLLGLLRFCFSKTVSNCLRFIFSFNDFLKFYLKSIYWNHYVVLISLNMFLCIFYYLTFEINDFTIINIICDSSILFQQMKHLMYTIIISLLHNND